MEVFEKLRITECLLAQALIDKEEMRELLSRKTVETFPEMKDLVEENRVLQQEVARLRGVAGFPGEVELLVRVKGEGGKMIERGAQEEDLLRLCDANGLVVLKRGQYICSRCGGIRCTTECKFCPE